MKVKTGGKGYRQSQGFKRMIRERDGYRCQICGCGIGDSCDKHWAVVSQLDVSHIVPHPLGSSTPDNLRTLCHSCNMRENTGTAGQPVTVGGRYYA